MTDEAWTTATLSDDGENPPGVPGLVCTYFVARSRLHVERSASTINTTRTVASTCITYQVRARSYNIPDIILAAPVAFVPLSARATELLEAFGTFAHRPSLARRGGLLLLSCDHGLHCSDEFM